MIASGPGKTSTMAVISGGIVPAMNGGSILPYAADAVMDNPTRPWPDTIVPLAELADAELPETAPTRTTAPKAAELAIASPETAPVSDSEPDAPDAVDDDPASV